MYIGRFAAQGSGEIASIKKRTRLLKGDRLHLFTEVMAAPPSIKISEEGLAKLREELSSEEMRIGLARIQELLVSMKATEHNNEAAKKMLGLTDEELEKIDDDIDMDHGALYLKIELTLKDQFKMTDTKNLNRVIRLVSDPYCTVVYVCVGLVHVQIY